MRRLSAVQEVLEVETPLQTIDQVRKLFRIVCKHSCKQRKVKIEKIKRITKRFKNFKGKYNIILYLFCRLTISRLSRIAAEKFTFSQSYFL